MPKNKKLTTKDFTINVKNNRYVIVTPFEEPNDVFKFIDKGCKFKFIDKGCKN